MNLIHDAWIPVRFQSGRTGTISPLALADDEEDPPVELNALRPDFNGALAQFLIGLLQWLAPDEEGEWRAIARGERRPELDTLRELAPHFAFDTGTHRFMQDMDFEPAEVGNLAGLLLEAPGENTVKNNADLFVKRSDGLSLSLPLAAQALLALQINAAEGGQGHRTSVRGGGPVSMLMWPDEINAKTAPLWQKLWLNTLVFDGDAPRSAIVFPWTTACLTSENARDVRSQLVAQSPSELELALLTYFATPRRVRLRFEDDQDCSLSGASARCATGYETRNLGASYPSELFRHPLSAYYRDKSGQFLPVHVGAIGFTYADWVNAQSTSESFSRPRVLDAGRLGATLGRGMRADAIWAFGYAMKSATCLAWHEARLPLLAIDPPERLARVTIEANAWIQGTELVRQALGKQLRSAWSDQGKGDTSTAERELYALTERAFYELLRECAALEAEDAELHAEHQLLRQRWQRVLSKKARALFERHAERDDAATAGVKALQRIALAHRALSKALTAELARKLELDAAKDHTTRRAGKGRKAA